MVSIAEAAEQYESSRTKNIAELESVSTSLELVEDNFEFTDRDGNIKNIKQEVVVIDDVKYRVPASVKQQLKVLLEDNPKLTKFKVKKTGTTKDDTRYQCIPLGS